MPSEWERMSLRDAGVTLIDCDHRTPPAVDSGYPYVAIPQLRHGRIEIHDARKIAAEHFEEWTRKAKPQAHDVVLSRRCNPGETAYVAPHMEFALGQNLVLLRADGAKIYPPFLRWLVRSPHWWGEVERFINVGAVFNSLKCADIPKFLLPLPTLQEQRAIADTLGALDDKIALLRETNATLEAIAQALFKSWFVDFDPVRAKAEGREPEGVPPEVADLFRSEFEDSELGAIPKGWRVGAFGDITDSVGGATPSTKEPAYWEGGHHCWATPKDLSGMDTPVLLDTERKITDAGLNKISSGLLPAGTVLMSSRAPIGYLAIAEVPVAVNQGFIAMKPKAGISNLFLLDLVRARMDEIKSHANGSTFMEISKAAFRPLKVVVPPIPVIQAFDNVARGLYERMVCNVQHVGTLTELRDTLLPHLMSGKLRISSPVTQSA